MGLSALGRFLSCAHTLHASLEPLPESVRSAIAAVMPMFRMPPTRAERHMAQPPAARTAADGEHAAGGEPPLPAADVGLATTFTRSRHKQASVSAAGSAGTSSQPLVPKPPPARRRPSGESAASHATTSDGSMPVECEEGPAAAAAEPEPEAVRQPPSATSDGVTASPSPRIHLEWDSPVHVADGEASAADPMDLGSEAVADADAGAEHGDSIARDGSFTLFTPPPKRKLSAEPMPPLSHREDEASSVIGGTAARAQTWLGDASPQTAAFGGDRLEWGLAASHPCVPPHDRSHRPCALCAPATPGGRFSLGCTHRRTLTQTRTPAPGHVQSGSCAVADAQLLTPAASGAGGSAETPSALLAAGIQKFDLSPPSPA